MPKPREPQLEQFCSESRENISFPCFQTARWNGRSDQWPKANTATEISREFFGTYPRLHIYFVVVDYGTVHVLVTDKSEFRA
jgi:hypothetical protein